VAAAQFKHTENPSKEYLPASQFIQLFADIAPVVVENLPAIHCSQIDTL
jgi:hypothetical protein